jgi:hypothetical protein
VKSDFTVTTFLAASHAAINVCIALTHQPLRAISALLNFSLLRFLQNLAVTGLVSSRRKQLFVVDFLPAWRGLATAMKDMALRPMMVQTAKRPAESTPNAGSTRNAPADFVVANRRFILMMALTVFQVRLHFITTRFSFSSDLFDFIHRFVHLK